MTFDEHKVGEDTKKKKSADFLKAVKNCRERDWSSSLSEIDYHSHKFK